jgi:hypothetical protein
MDENPTRRALMSETKPMKAATIISTFIAMAITTKTAFALDAERAVRMDALFKDFDHPNAPGASLMVIHKGKSVFAKGYGLADLVTKTPCTTNTNFRLASVSKQFTAMSVEAGRKAPGFFSRVSGLRKANHREQLAHPHVRIAGLRGFDSVRHDDSRARSGCAATCD